MERKGSIYIERKKEKGSEIGREEESGEEESKREKREKMKRELGKERIGVKVRCGLWSVCRQRVEQMRREHVRGKCQEV